MCLGVQHADDSNMKWQQQGVLHKAHNLLKSGQSSTRWPNKCIVGVRKDKRD